MLEILDTLVEFDTLVTLDTDLFWAVLQKSVLHLEWSPKQCKGAFIKSFCSLAIADDLSGSLLLITIAQRAALVSRLRIASVNFPLPL